MSDRRLHVDVTHLFDRPYRPTGLTRIIAQLARAVRETSDSAEAWRYDLASRSFRRVPWRDVERIAGLAVANGGSGQESSLHRLREATGRLLRPILVIRVMLRRAMMAAAGRDGLPSFSGTDLFIFADILDDDGKLEAYRSLIESKGVRVLFYCHDVIPLKFRAFVTDKLHGEFQRMIKIFSGDHVTTICNSEATRGDLQRARADMGLANDAPAVVSPGCDIQLRDEEDEAAEPDAVTGPYILYVSTVEIRKNHRLLLQAWDLMGRDGSFDPPQLVLVGQRGWLADDILEEIDEGRGAASRVALLTGVSDADLARLYKGARFTVYPSLYEGWGIPVAESLYHGKFCISSDRGALPEAGGRFADYLDPEDAVQWARRIRHYLDHPEELRERERRIKDGFVPRRWSDFRRDAKALLTSALATRI